ncbi:MAG: DUF4331 domain-containing protein [Candidatus Tectomicrobia bacterium]|nr:DUF4331 domain-containing protein [Candidatus Tectomicrobia bacterium]
MQQRLAITLVLVLALTSMPVLPVRASSHMDAPLITFDDAANTTDVYAFVTMRDGVKYLSTAVAVYPFEDPGIGPNKYNFDDNVRYSIHVATGRDVARGRATYTYDFEFQTRFKSQDTILQSFLGVINDVDDAAQNLTQTYKVTREDRRTRQRTVLGRGVVPPNNQGIATPFYNHDGDDGTPGKGPAKDGVANAADLDRYTAQTIFPLDNGHAVFSGQRDDGFYADIQAVFDLLRLRDPGKDSQKGFNVHTIVLDIPVSEIDGDQQIVGVYATTSRRQVKVLRGNPLRNPITRGRFVQVGRQGNPLYNEGFVAIKDKDNYNRTSPTRDRELFSIYAKEPELARLINAILVEPDIPGIETNRTDIAGIYIPDVIKVDLSTGPARLAGGGPDHPTNPDDDGFSRLSIFGGDVLTSAIQDGFGGGAVPGGWPNGRRFGDDVLDIAVTAAISDLRVIPPVVPGIVGDNVDANDIAYNKVFPYAAPPLNGRQHSHDD